MKPNFNSFTNVLSTSSTLQNLVNTSARLSKLNNDVLKKLDPSLKAHCRVTNYRDGILILSTSSPAFGHTLRFSETDLLSALRKDANFAALKSIQTRVRPIEPLERSSTMALKAPTLSNQSAAHIRAAAMDIEPPGLRKILLRLAARAREDTGSSPPTQPSLDINK